MVNLEMIFCRTSGRFSRGNKITMVGWLVGYAKTKKKNPLINNGLYLFNGGEGGIRTLDTLPYTHFPGVLLQPLGHLSGYCLLWRAAAGEYTRSRACSKQLHFVSGLIVPAKVPVPGQTLP